MKQNILVLFLIITTTNFVFSQGNQTQKDSTKKKVEFAFIPMVSYNNSFGGQIGFMANGFFDINKSDTISPVSKLGLFGSYFTNGTFFTGIISNNYFSEDKWRTRTILAYGNIEFQTYVDVSGFVGSADGGTIIVDYNTK